MIKNWLIFVFAIIVSVTAVSQSLSPYYTSATGLSGDTLKTVLHNIIKNHTEYPYTSALTDTWDILKVSDSAPGYSDKVVCVYTGWLRDKAAEYPQWSREHVWAKSHGDFGTTIGPGTDLHNLKPCDVSVNSARNNRDFDNGGTLYIDGDGPTECHTSTYTWEPRDEVKGDIARIIFYMDVRYEGGSGEPELEVVDYINTAPNLEPYHGKLSTLLQWNIEDPVDSFEMNRNNVIFSYQNNRNPFIDYPEFAGYIWGGLSPVVNIQQQINLVQGWSIISTNLLPQYLNIDSIFNDVSSNLILLKNNGGSVYWPQFNLNMIGDIETGQGYFCKMSSVQTLTVAGTPVVLSTNPVNLLQGWNTIGYLPQVSATTNFILTPIINSILILKDGNGNIFWPAFGIDLIGNMHPGKGYQVNMSNSVQFYFPE